ncbi:hypothetical protein [Nocardia flavorosea]|uniref:Uncharacterized protein n=1 Tax=Nocardia flavorosea TaxID=53429 RepID=A0A846YTH2_9NOCA|nr:hypothetical protein [Nocardia flavorosea]NKY60798.1 hypothetical protein [Nocardia flavorosea]
MARIDNGAWLAYPNVGDQPGAGGDAFEVRYFGNDDLSELRALRYSNDNPGFRALYMAPGESILEAEENSD